MFRTHTCGELNPHHINKNVTLAGWVQTVRKFGSITFVDLRDRYGITQLLFSEALNALLEANPLGREFVLQVTGTVNERSNKNKNSPTGDIEIAVHSFSILNKSITPPFTIQDDTDGGDELRMKYRFLDLRRNAVKKNLEIRYAVGRSTPKRPPTLITLVGRPGRFRPQRALSASWTPWLPKSPLPYSHVQCQS